MRAYRIKILPNRRLILLIACLVCNTAAVAQKSAADDDDWFGPDPDESLRTINEGKLVFLQKLPDKPVHHHQTRLEITEESLKKGWVKLFQCHENIDNFPRAQIVYNRDRVRNIRITRHQNIEQSWVEGHTIQIRNAGKNAQLCLEAESHTITKSPRGIYTMQNGPFMRKFLDGYFPMQVSLEVRFPSSLQFLGIDPGEQPGFHIIHKRNSIKFNAWFEGRLTTRIYFRDKRLTKP